MQTYYFYQDTTDHYTYIQKTASRDQSPIFIWIDCTREDVVNRAEAWQQQIQQASGLCLNELHVQDILNLEHPCVFDAIEDYNLLIFRKLITRDDHITADAAEEHERIFGLATSPVSFVIKPNTLVSVRETGNKAMESFIARIEMIVSREIEQQNKPRKLASSPIDLTLRLLNSMVDEYVDIRVPLTKRVEYWQQALLQGHRRFNQWHQLLQENMAFQQIENLCEEQIEVIQELSDEIIDNEQHHRAKKNLERADILLMRIHDLSNHIERIQKHTARFSSAIKAAIELHFSAISNQTNENMRILAIITAVFAPLTLLTGIYGMNFEFIPGLASPHGFWIMLGLMLLTTMLLIYYFYRRHLVGRGEKSVIDLLAQKHPNQRVNLLWFLDYEPIKHTMQEVSKLTKLK